MIVSDRVRVLLALLCLVASAGLVLAGGSAMPASAATTSAVTQHGKDEFSNLAVTVSKTTHLRNQVVDVSWSGGTATAPSIGNFAVNFLQIFQCWGDGPEPEREKCQFGGFGGDTRGGSWVGNRQVSYGGGLVDDAETYKPGSAPGAVARVPFQSVTGVTTDEVRNDFFDQYTTNEIPLARTYADGTGTAQFEVQTAKEAAGLGCGQPTVNGPRSCWLVVVPRGDKEVDAKTPPERLNSSPLSATNWKQRISFRLDFDPVATSCTLGGAELAINGQESLVEAMSSWQPALCAATKSNFGYWQMSDDLARSQVLGLDPQLSVVTRPVATDLVPADKKLVYAPLAASGIGIAFNIDRKVLPDASPAEKAKAGSRVEELKLSPRLIVKLLTQSYQSASLKRELLPEDNPAALGSDPEFLNLNPEFRELNITSLSRIQVPTGMSDAYAELWNWLGQDQSVRDFLSGQPDPWGMEVNPAWKDASTDTASFPILDLNCRPGDGIPIEEGGVSDLCPLDFLSYAADMHEGLRSAARGQVLSRSLWGSTGWKLDVPQLSGERGVLALSDTATAKLFGVPMASLRTTGRTYVRPDDAGLSASLASLKESATPGVFESSVPSASAYPLTHVSYGVTNPQALSADQARDYAAFVTYAAGSGQVPGSEIGQLPEGYVPLPEPMRAAARSTVALIAAGPTKPVKSPKPSAKPTPGASDTAGPVVGSDLSGGAPAASIAPSSVIAAPNPMATSVAFVTPADPSASGRWVVVVALAAAAVILAGRPFARWYLRQRQVAP